MTATTTTKIRRPTPTPRLVDAKLGELLRDNATLTEQEIRDILARQAEFSLIEYGESALSLKVVVAYDPYCKRAEELRTARSELALRWFGHGNRVLAVLEARRGQGGSLLAANLAVTFAQLGERTLLIDANLRAPAQHTLFGLTPQRGLVDFLKGRESLDKTITPVPGFSCLSVMCTGKLPPNPQELLGNFSFGYLMESAPAKFEVVIVDAPPMLECADAQLIAARAGGAVLAVKRHHTTVADARRVSALLQPAGATLLGSVIDG